MNRSFHPELAVICSLISFFLTTSAGISEAGRLDAGLARELDTAPSIREFAVLVKLKQISRPELAAIPELHEDRRERAARLVRQLKSDASQSQQGVRNTLRSKESAGSARDVRPFWIYNGIALIATADTIRELIARDDVESVEPDRVYTLASTSVAPASSGIWNLDLIGAPSLWSRGLTGSGAVVANMDTGVDLTHPALTGKWRGGSNSWFDPYNGSTTPYDLSGHGTATMGVMVAGNSSDNPVGVAPGATWIAAKIFDDAKPPNAVTSKIHAAFQWLLDPDLTPATHDLPDVVNISMDLGNPGTYDGQFAPDIQSLKAAGINVVCSAGNISVFKQSGTSTSPGNNPGAFAVGATDANDVIAGFSARGPSAFDGSFYPAVTAPGAGIRTTDLYSTYASFSGTSFAAPHVAGAIALLKSALPGLTADQVETALKNSVVGAAGPDNIYGYGRLNILKAYAYLALPGDVSGDGNIDIVDVMITLRTIVGLSPSNGLIEKNANIFPLGVTGKPLGHSGPVNLQDVLLMLQKSFGLVNW